MVLVVRGLWGGQSRWCHRRSCHFWGQDRSWQLLLRLDLLIAQFVGLLLLVLLLRDNGKIVSVSPGVGEATRAKVHLVHAHLNLLRVELLHSRRHLELGCLPIELELLCHDACIGWGIHDIVGLVLGAREVLQRRLDPVFLNDLPQLGHESTVQLVFVVAFLLRVAPVIDANLLLLRVADLPVLVLVLLIEVHDEKWVLEVDEKVPHVVTFLGLFLISDDIQSAISVPVISVNLVLEFLLVEATWDVFDAKVGT